MAAKKFRGVYAFCVTPTRNDGAEIDNDKLRQFLDWNIAEGVHGLCVFGSTGANGVFTPEEKERTIKLAVEHVKGRVPVIAGIGAHTTAEVVRLAKSSQDNGADGVLVVPMNYWPLTEGEVYQHYKTIAEAIKIPIVIYNNPWTTRVDIKPPLVAKLAEIENIRYIKESTGDLTRISEIRRLTRDGITVFGGWESTTLEAFIAGADGWFSGMTNLTPRLCREFFDVAVEKRNWLGAREAFDRIFPLCLFMCDKSHVRVAHTALDLMGRSMGPPRRPLRMLEPADRETLARLLRQVGAMQ